MASVDLQLRKWRRTQSNMTGGSEEKIQTGSVAFKYYIHDTSEGYALQMSGPLTRACIPELTSCWETAKTTLQKRRLTLDVRRLTSADECGQQWLTFMAALENALFLPESFLRDNAAGIPTLPPQAKRNVFRRWVEALRGFNQTKTVNADSARVTGR